MTAKQQQVERKSFVQEMLEEELKRCTESKNKTELQLARTKNNIRKHEQNLCKNEAETQRNDGENTRRRNGVGVSKG